MLACNCSVVGDDETKEAIVIDPGDEIERVQRILTQHDLKVRYIIATHAHIDHSGLLPKLCARGFRGRILTSDWSLYDGHHAVMRPALARPYQLQLAVAGAMEHFYSPRRIVLPGIAAALRLAPTLAPLAFRGEFSSRFPALSRLLIPPRGPELRDGLAQAMPSADWGRLEHAFTVPALRRYGRGQLASWREQPHSQAHLAFLAGLG